jgi:NADPH:quinone reductase-like Zn-dependent oxidoreductase
LTTIAWTSTANPKTVARPGEVFVQVKAAVVNPSDIKNVLAGMDESGKPY